MGLFSRKKKTEDAQPGVQAKKTTKSARSADAAATKKDVSSVSSESVGGSSNVLSVIRGPRVSEKGAVVAESANAYVFNVTPGATKPQIEAAIQKIYKVTPVKIRVSTIPTKNVQIRGRRSGKVGTKGGGKKAFVYLKKGEKIEFI